MTKTLLHALLLAAASTHAAAAERYWSGTGPNRLWSTPANWAYNVAPLAGDRLVFPAGALQDASENDLDIPFDSIVLTNPYSHNFHGDITLTSDSPVTAYGKAYFRGNLRIASRNADIVNAKGVTAYGPGVWFARLFVHGGTVRIRADVLQSGYQIPDVSLGEIIEAEPTRIVVENSHQLELTAAGNPFAGEISASVKEVHLSTGGALGTGPGPFRLEKGDLWLGIWGETTNPFVVAKPLYLAPGTLANLWGGRTLEGAVETHGRFYVKGAQWITGAVSGSDLVLDAYAFDPPALNSLTLANPGNNYAGATRIRNGALQMGASGVLPATTGVVIDNGMLVVRATSQRVRTLACDGVLDLMLRDGMLWVTGAVPDLSQCELDLYVPNDFQVSAAPEVLMLRNGGPASIDKPFMGLPDGTRWAIRPPQPDFMYLTYRAGPKGRDVAMVQRLPRECAPVDTSGDCNSDILWKRTDGGHALWLMEGAAQAGGAALPLAGNVTHAGDLDADGRADFLLERADGAVDAILLKGSALAGTVPMRAAGSGWTPRLVARFDDDSRADIVWQRSDGDVEMWLGGATPTTTARLIAPGTSWSPTHACDFNGDGLDDLLWKHADGRSALWLMNGAAQVGGSALIGAGTGWSARHVADFDGDGKCDIVWERGDGSVAMWLMDGAVQKGGALLVGAGTGWSAAGTADFDGDGKADIAWRHADGRAALWLMDGAALRSATLLVPAGTGWSIARLADFDGDRRSDLLWRHADGSVSLWLMNGATQVGGARLIGPGTGWGPVDVRHESRLR